MHARRRLSGATRVNCSSLQSLSICSESGCSAGSGADAARLLAICCQHATCMTMRQNNCQVRNLTGRFCNGKTRTESPKTASVFGVEVAWVERTLCSSGYREHQQLITANGEDGSIAATSQSDCLLTYLVTEFRILWSQRVAFRHQWYRTNLTINCRLPFDRFIERMILSPPNRVACDVGMCLIGDLKWQAHFENRASAASVRASDSSSVIVRPASASAIPRRIAARSASC